MTIDAASMADQMAYYDTYSSYTRYETRLALLKAQSSMVTKVDNSLDALDNILYKFTKPSGSFAQSATTLSSEDYFSVDAAGYAKNINMDIYVEQTAAAHQVAVNTNATDGSDEFAGSTGTIEIDFGGETYTLDIADAAGSDGVTTYQEFVNYFNDEMDGMVNATLVRSGGEIKLLFSSEETGAENQFEVRANTGSYLDSEMTAANDNPIKEGRDAVIWMGDYGSGVQLTNSSNTFENIVDGVDITVSKANAVGDDSTNLRIGPDEAATIETLNEFITAFNATLAVLDEATRTGGTSSDDDSEERGVLASDGTIRGIETKLKSLIRSSYDGVSLFEVGLSLNKDGQLELDEDKFKEAANEYDLEEIFNGENGLFKTMESTIEQYADYTTGSLQAKKDRLAQDQERVNDKLDQLDTKYEMYYQRYLKQYTNLNTIIMSMDSVSGLFA